MMKKLKKLSIIALLSYDLLIKISKIFSKTIYIVSFQMISGCQIDDFKNDMFFKRHRGLEGFLGRRLVATVAEFHPKKITEM